MNKTLLFTLLISFNLCSQELWKIDLDNASIEYSGSHFIHNWSAQNNKISGLLNIKNSLIENIGVIAKVEDLKYQIEMALAGFSKKDIEVKSQENTLTIKSKDKKEEVLDKDEDILHRGISQRSFTRSFTVAEDVVVKGADLKDGLLSVKLERIIPDEKKPKIIDIK